MAATHQSVSYHCSDCGGTLSLEGGFWQCLDCGHVPKHGAD